jgi:hypothetical protein
VFATLLTWMTGISLHMQWRLTSQLHGSFFKEDNCFLLRIKLHALIRLGVSPPSFDTGTLYSFWCYDLMSKVQNVERQWRNKFWKRRINLKVFKNIDCSLHCPIKVGTFCWPAKVRRTPRHRSLLLQTHALGIENKSGSSKTQIETFLLPGNKEKIRPQLFAHKALPRVSGQQNWKNILLNLLLFFIVLLAKFASTVGSGSNMYVRVSTLS